MPGRSRMTALAANTRTWRNRGGKIQDYLAVGNIERDEPDENKEEYESQYTQDDIALLDEQQQESSGSGNCRRQRA